MEIGMSIQIGFNVLVSFAYVGMKDQFAKPVPPRNLIMATECDQCYNLNKNRCKVVVVIIIIIVVEGNDS
jgi:hypothetical protein